MRNLNSISQSFLTLALCKLITFLLTAWQTSRSPCEEVARYHHHLVRFGISLSQKSAALMCYGNILLERYSTAAGGKAPSDVPDRVAFKLIVTVHRCLNGRAPNDLLNHVVPVSAIVSRQHLRSAQQNTLVVPRYRLTTYGRRALSVAGPTAWNSLPVAFRDPTKRPSAMPASDGIKDSSVRTTASAP